MLRILEILKVDFTPPSFTTITGPVSSLLASVKGATGSRSPEAPNGGRRDRVRMAAKRTLDTFPLNTLFSRRAERVLLSCLPGEGWGFKGATPPYLFAMRKRANMAKSAHLRIKKGICSKLLKNINVHFRFSVKTLRVLGKVIADFILKICNTHFFGKVIAILIANNCNVFAD